MYGKNYNCLQCFLSMSKGLTREGKIYAFEVDGVEISDEEEIGQLEVQGVNVVDTPFTDTETGGFTGLTYKLGIFA